MGLSSMQQVLIALSTYCLVQAGLQYQNPQKLLAWALGSLAFHLVAPALQIIVKKWEYDLLFDSYKNFLRKNLLEKYGASTLWRQKDLKESFMASLGIDAEGYLGAILYVGLDIFSFTLSLILGIAVLGSTVDATFVPAFIASALLSYLCYQLLSRQVRENYELEQQARTSFNGYILNAWDNVFFKNSSVSSNYQQRLETKYQGAKEATKAAAVSSEYLVFVLGIISAIPIMICVAWIGIVNIETNNTAALLALLATLPRQMNMLNTFRSIFSNVAAFLGFNAKFAVLHEAVQLQQQDHQQQICLEKMTLNGKSFKDLKSLEKEIGLLPKGRHEIRGANGSGKSTLLLHLNAQLESSFYLPASPDLEIGDDTNESSGEKLLRHMQYLMSQPEPVLLLDEWDANLDHANMDKISKILTALAADKIIIEVRHRLDSGHS